MMQYHLSQSLQVFSSIQENVSSTYMLESILQESLIMNYIQRTLIGYWTVQEYGSVYIR